MPRNFTTQQIQDADINQIIILKSINTNGQVVVRVRASVAVKLVDNADPSRVEYINLNLNKTIQELGISQQVVAIKAAILSELQKQIA